MRLPLGKIYRAFQELDQFDDQQCEWYLGRAKRRHLLSMLVVAILAVVVTLSVFVGTVYVEMRVVMATENMAISRSFQSSRWSELFVLLGILLPILVGLIAGLLIRDAWLLWAIRKELTQSLCVKCDYQLLGLPVKASNVICPECGLVNKVPDGSAWGGTTQIESHMGAGVSVSP